MPQTMNSGIRAIMNFMRNCKWSALIVAATAIVFVQCKDNGESQHPYFQNPLENPADGPAAGNQESNYPIPAEAGPEDVSNPTHIIRHRNARECNRRGIYQSSSRRRYHYI